MLSIHVTLWQVACITVAQCCTLLAPFTSQLLVACSVPLSVASGTQQSRVVLWFQGLHLLRLGMLFHCYAARILAVRALHLELV